MAEATYLGYGDFHFAWGDHICAIFDGPSQQAEVMTGFYAQGLRAAQRCVWVGPRASAERFRGGVAAMGGDLPTLEASGQLLVVCDIDFYLRDNLFDPDRVMALVHTLVEDGQRSGYGAMRLATDMTWLRGYRMDPDRWEEFEGKLTQEVAGLPLVLVCQYDRRQVSGAIVVAAFRTHPIVILGETIHDNPFYAAATAGPAVSDIV
jgi:hypothetical protein